MFGCDPHTYARETLPRVGFVAQNHPLYKHFTVADLLNMGRKMNLQWDQRMAEERLAMLDIPPGQRAGKLSGGQQAPVLPATALCDLGPLSFCYSENATRQPGLDYRRYLDGPCWPLHLK